MNILHIIFSFELGGTENMLVDIANEQVKNHNVTIVIINNIYDDRLIALLDDKVKLIKLERPEGTKNPLQLLKVKLLTHSLKPKIVHLHDQQTLKLFPFKTRRRFTLLYTIHTTGTSYGKEIHNADYVCSISNAVQEDLKKRTGLDSVVVHNGIVFENVTQKQQTTIQDRSFKVLQIGRFSLREKGQDLLIKAITTLRDKGVDITLDFIGDGPDRNLIEEQIQTVNATSYIRLQGSLPKDEIYSQICEFDLVCQPSRIEGFGLTMIEAMAAKVPVLASNIEGPSEVVGHGLYGTLFTSESVDSLVEEIEKQMFAYDTDESLSRVESAYDYAYESFSICEVAQKYVDFALTKE